MGSEKIPPNLKPTRNVYIHMLKNNPAKFYDNHSDSLRK